MIFVDSIFNKDSLYIPINNSALHFVSFHFCPGEYIFAQSIMVMYAHPAEFSGWSVAKF